jgi:hypothetical protein
MKNIEHNLVQVNDIFYVIKESILEIDRKSKHGDFLYRGSVRYIDKTYSYMSEKDKNRLLLLGLQAREVYDTEHYFLPVEKEISDMPDGRRKEIKKRLYEDMTKKVRFNRALCEKHIANLFKKYFEEVALVTTHELGQIVLEQDIDFKDTIFENGWWFTRDDLLYGWRATLIENHREHCGEIICAIQSNQLEKLKDKRFS